MEVYKKSGTKERLFEMFENVNKITLNEDAPVGYKVELINIDPSDPNLINSYLPSTINADGSQILRSPQDISRWKEEFISKFGDQGIIEKGRSLPHTFDLVGNEAYDQWSNKMIGAKSADIQSKRDQGANTMMDSYKPTTNENENVNQEIDDELDMRYSQATKTIPYDEINDVAEMYNADFETVAQIAADVISRNQNQGYEEITDDVKELIKRFQDNNVEIHTISTKDAWEVFEHEYQASSEFEEFKQIWDKFTKNPNQTTMFPESETKELDSIKFDYDGNGNWIPVGYEDKKIGLRSIEKPIGSGNWKVGVVQLTPEGEYEKIYTLKDSWEEARNALHSSLT